MLLYNKYMTGMCEKRAGKGDRNCKAANNPTTKHIDYHPGKKLV